FFNCTPPTAIYPLSLHDALPIFQHSNTSTHYRRSPDGDRIFHRRVAEIRRFFLGDHQDGCLCMKHPRMYLRLLRTAEPGRLVGRSEEHTSELQSRENLVCRLLLE